MKSNSRQSVLDEDWFSSTGLPQLQPPSISSPLVVSPPAKQHPPTPQMMDAIDWARAAACRHQLGSLFIGALAGTGKTTLLLKILPYLTGHVALCAFNATVGAELSARVSALGLVPVDDDSSTTAGTIHTLGKRTIEQYLGHPVKVEQSRVARLLKEELDRRPEWRKFLAELGPGSSKTIVHWVDLAKQAGVGLPSSSTFLELPPNHLPTWVAIAEQHGLFRPGTPTWAKEDAAEMAQGLLMVAEAPWQTALNPRSGISGGPAGSGPLTMDFSDMLRLPLMLPAGAYQPGGPIRTYRFMLVDEMQDLNVARQLLVCRLLQPAGQAIGVGDVNQAIYGFTGAEADAIERFPYRVQEWQVNVQRENPRSARPSIEERNQRHPITNLPLTVTFRNTRAIVSWVQVNYEPLFEAWSGAEEGQPPTTITEQEFWDRVTLQYGDAIVCRNTAPLVKAALKLLLKRVPVEIKGRDLKTRLLSLAQEYSLEITGRGSRRMVTERTMEGALQQLSADKLALLKEMTRLRDSLETESLSGMAMQGDYLDALIAIIYTLVPDKKERERIQAGDRLKSTIESLFDEQGAAVVLSTIHKAKGLEWDRVFVWGKNVLQPSPWARKDWELAQENNLMYVAETRGRKELVFVDLPEKEKERRGKEGKEGKEGWGE